jgi:hypothetical protein
MKVTFMDNVTLLQEGAGNLNEFNYISSQAPSLDIKATWVYEIKRSVLENQDNITPQMREVLLKGIPSMDKTNQFNDILHNSKYTS